MARKDLDKAARDVRKHAAALREACERASVASDSIPDPQEALATVAPLADFIDATARTIANFGAKLRARPVRRIWKSEELSLAKLADRIGVSRQRAGRILQAAEDRDPPKENPDE